LPEGHSPTLVFTSFPGNDVRNILSERNIDAIFLDDLIRKHFHVDNSELIHWYIKSKIESIDIKIDSSRTITKGEKLIKRLEDCPPGNKHWSEYESIGIDIFTFLFKDNFRKYLFKDQVENSLKNHRRDLVVNNNYMGPSSFWADVKKSYNCSAIIIDFKNYSKKLDSKMFFSVAKYTKKNVGDFAIIFSRKGINKTAKIEQSQMFSNKKLLLEFSDIELIEMIREKIIGKNPIDRLESKKFALVIKY